MGGGAHDLVVEQASQPPYALGKEGRELAVACSACLRSHLAQLGSFRIESKPMPCGGVSARGKRWAILPYAASSSLAQLRTVLIIAAPPALVYWVDVNVLTAAVVLKPG